MVGREGSEDDDKEEEEDDDDEEEEEEEEEGAEFDDIFWMKVSISILCSSLKEGCKLGEEIEEK